MTKLSPLFTWRSAITDANLDATAKHVALTLSLHMNERGDSAFPSLETQATETSRSKGTVSKALQRLRAAGWLYIEKPERKGRGHVTHYRAVVPETVLRGNLSGKGTDTETVRSGAETVRSGKRNGTAVVPEDVQRERQEDVQPSIAVRPRDEIWDVLEELYGEAPSGNGKRNAAVKRLRQAGADADSVRRRFQSLIATPESWAVITEHALGQHWGNKAILAKQRTGPGTRTGLLADRLRREGR